MNENAVAKRLLWTFGWLVGHFVAALVVLVCLVREVPVFEKIFKDFGTDLPALTRVIIMSSRWMAAYWWLAFAVGFVVDAGLLFGLRCLPPGGRWLSTLWAVCVLLAAVVLLGAILAAVAMPLLGICQSLELGPVQ